MERSTVYIVEWGAQGPTGKEVWNIMHSCPLFLSREAAREGLRDWYKKQGASEDTLFRKRFKFRIAAYTRQTATQVTL